MTVASGSRFAKSAVRTTVTAVVLASLLLVATLSLPKCRSFSASGFHGRRLAVPTTTAAGSPVQFAIAMRKQKASDKRTRRLQRGDARAVQLVVEENLRKSIEQPLTSMTKTAWKSTNSKKSRALLNKPRQPSGGRGRSRKRSTVYNSLSSYRNRFLKLLSTEYRAEEQEVISRIKASVDDPLRLESVSGHALYDMYPQRRGNLFSDEVYRFVKATDATQVCYNNIGSPSASDNSNDAYSSTDSLQSATSKNRRQGDSERRPRQRLSLLPPNHKFSENDVVMVTLQPAGSGDFFDLNNYPTGLNAVSVEARVSATGPTYVDIVMPGGAFENAFGPAPNDCHAERGTNANIRLRLDRFFSDVPYARMVSAVTQLTTVPERNSNNGKQQAAQMGIQPDDNPANNKPPSTRPRMKSRIKVETATSNPHDSIRMDDTLRELIIATHAFTDPESPLFHDNQVCNLQELANQIAKPPMPTSVKLANQALAFMQQQASISFPPLNGPQLTAVGAALTRKFTAITGPPGTGKTTVASAIGFGFTHQCRSISPCAKVLATAFSNVGADNLVEGFKKLGLKVVRVGKPSSVSESLWDVTLDAIVDQDPEVQAAMATAARATGQLSKLKLASKGGRSADTLNQRTAREIATEAVKQSIRAKNVAAARALRQADVIVATSVGAANSQLLAACGMGTDMDEILRQDTRLNDKPATSKRIRVTSSQGSGKGKIEASGRGLAPDGLPPLSLPFVIVDEACQSVEPATLIPLTASNSCRSLVVLGDPCQLPATVKHDPDSVLGISLMERMASTLPHPMVSTQPDTTEKDDRYLRTLPIKQARSLRRALESQGRKQCGSASSSSVTRDSYQWSTSYKKNFPGSLLLSVQYRMHPSISAFSSAMFYDGLLSTPWQMGPMRPFPSHMALSLPASPSDHEVNVRMINVGGRHNEQRGNGVDRDMKSALAGDATVAEGSTTYCNTIEAKRVLDLIHDALVNNDGTDVSIGVITPYTGQVQLIHRMIQEDDRIPNVNKNRIEVRSVDGYQGRERDIIIFSAVRSNRQDNVGFLSDWRRLNVALTRARNALVVVGDSDTLAAGDKNWAAFVKWCEGMDCLVG